MFEGNQSIINLLSNHSTYHKCISKGVKIARVAELVDAPDSKSGARNGVRVRVPPLAPLKFVGNS